MLPLPWARERRSRIKVLFPKGHCPLTPLFPHVPPSRGCYTLALLSPPNVHLGYACDEAATSFLVLTALRHSGRSFTAHVAESAEVSMGLCPIPYARVLYPRAPMLFVYSSFKRPFCQGIPSKKFACFGVTPSRLSQPNEHTKTPRDSAHIQHRDAGTICTLLQNHMTK